MQRRLASFLVLGLLFLTFVTVYPPGPAAASRAATGPQNADVLTTPTPGMSVARDAVSSSTTGPTINIVVHVQDQYGLWINGAQVQVFYEQPGITPGLTLVSSGSTANGLYLAANLTASSTYTVDVYSPTGGAANQTVTVGFNDAVLTFVLPTAAPPVLAVQGVSVVPNSTSPSAPFSLSGSVVNTSNSTAYNTVLSVSPPPQFSLLNTGSVIPIGTLAPGASKPFTLTMTVSSTATASSYTVGYLLNFSDYSGVNHASSGSISLPTPPAPYLVVQDVVLNPSTIQPGAFFSVTANVSNTSNSTAYNTVLSVSPPPQFSLLNTGSVIPIGTLAPGASKPFTLTMTVSSTATASSYTVAFTASFTDYFLNKFSTPGNLFIPITGDALHPNLVITSASFSSQSIHPGESFSIPMSIQNIAVAAAEEVVLSVNVTTPVAIVGSAGAYRLGSIAGNGNTSITLQFTSASTAALGAYPITLILSYVDSSGAIYTSHQTLVATLIGEPNLVLNSLRFKSNPLTPGLQTFLSAQLLNVGGDNALNVKVTFQGGPSFLGNTTMYLGSIGPSGSGNGTAYLQVPADTAIGDYSFEAVVTYTDSSGSAYSANSPYSVTVAPFSGPRVSVTNTLLSPPVLSPGTQGTFTIYVKNDGSSPARNVTLNMEDGGRLFTSSLIGLGSLDSLTSGTTVIGVNVDPSLNGGQYIVHILVMYQDDNGVKYNSTTPIQVTVYRSSSLLTLTNVGMAAGVGVVGLAVVLFLRRNGSKKL
jgi:hypothetical protein